MWMPSVYRTTPSTGVTSMTGTSSSVRRPGGGQPAAGLGDAQQDVGERVAVLLAAEPAQQHGRHVVAPRHQHRRAGVDHDDGARVRRGHGADQVVLPAGQASDVRS